MARKKIIKNQKVPKLLTYTGKKEPHQYDLFKKPGSATIDLEAQKKAGIRIDPKFRRKGVVNYINTPKKTLLHTPSKPTKKAIWIEGYKDIQDADAVRRTLDQIWSDTMGTYKAEDVEIWYGGYKGSDTDMEIELWSEKKGIQTRVISPFNPKYVKDQSGTPKQKIQRRGKLLKKLEARGAKGGKEGRQLLNMYNINDVGEIKYNYADTSKWWDRYSELQDIYGKGATAKVVEAYLDEVEDVKHAKHPEHPNITSTLAALEVLEDKNKYYRKNAEDYNQMLIDQGHYDPSGTPEAIAFNKEQATQPLVEGSGYLKKPKVIKDLYSEAVKTRIANIRGDVSYPLKTFEEIRTDYADVPGIEEGKEYVDDSSTFHRGQPYSLKKQDYVDKGEGEFKGKRIEKNRINKSSLSIPKGQEIVDFSRPKVSKSQTIRDIVSELVNKQTEELGYSGKNVFGDFFAPERKKDEKAQIYEGKTEEDATRKVSVDQAEHLEQRQEVLRQEIAGLDDLVEKEKKFALKSHWDTRGSKSRRQSILTEYYRIGDVDAPDQVSVLESPFTTDEAKKKGTSGKIKGETKKKYRTQAEIKKALPSEMKVIKEKLDQDFTKYPNLRTGETTYKTEAIRKAKTIRKIVGRTPSVISDGKVLPISGVTGYGKVGKRDRVLTSGTIRHGTVQELAPSHLEGGKPITDHSDWPGKKQYLKMRTNADIVQELKTEGKVIGESRGVLSRAYVSEPSMASTSDIRKELQKSPKRVLPKGIAQIIKNKQIKVPPVEKELKSLSKIKRNKSRIREKQNITKTVQVREKKIKGLLKAPSETPQGDTIKMTQSKRTGKWGTPSEHRKEALKILGRKLSRTLGPLSIVPMITGAIRAHKEAQEYTGEQNPNFSTTMKMMYPHLMGLPRKKGERHWSDPI